MQLSLLKYKGGVMNMLKQLEEKLDMPGRVGKRVKNRKC